MQCPVLRNLYGHSVRMDIVARDSAGRQFDLEAQRKIERSIPRRLRYYSSMTDTRMLSSGRNYDDLQNSYTIFIMENDIGKRDQPFYCFKRWDGSREMEDSLKVFSRGRFLSTSPRKRRFTKKSSRKKSSRTRNQPFACVFA